MHTKAPHEQFLPLRHPRHGIPASDGIFLSSSTGFFHRPKHRGRRPCLHQHPVAHRGCHPCHGAGHRLRRQRGDDPRHGRGRHGKGPGRAGQHAFVPGCGHRAADGGAGPFIPVAAPPAWRNRRAVPARGGLHRCRRAGGRPADIQQRIEPSAARKRAYRRRNGHHDFQPAVQHPAGLAVHRRIRLGHARRGAGHRNGAGPFGAGRTAVPAYEQKRSRPRAPVLPRSAPVQKTAYGGRFSVWAFHVRQCAHHAQQLAVHPLRRRGRCCYLRHPQLCTGGAAAAFVRYRRGHPAAGELLPRCGRPCGPASFTAPRAAFTAGGGHGAVRRHIPCSGTAAAAVWRFVRDRPGKRSRPVVCRRLAASLGRGAPVRLLLLRHRADAPQPVLYFWRSAWRKPPVSVPSAADAGRERHLGRGSRNTGAAVPLPAGHVPPGWPPRRAAHLKTPFFHGPPACATTG